MTRTFSKSEGIVAREVGGELVLVPIMGDMEALGSVFALNAQAATIWDAIEKGFSEEKIVSTILEAYDVDEETAAADTARILDELTAVGAITLC